MCCVSVSKRQSIAPYYRSIDLFQIEFNTQIGYTLGNSNEEDKMATAAARTAEIKTRTTDQVKADAASVYSRWGLSLSDAINMFLIKSIEVGGLPFNLRMEKPSYEAVAARAHHAKLNADGVAVLPADWDDDDE